MIGISFGEIVIISVVSLIVMDVKDFSELYKNIIIFKNKAQNYLKNITNDVIISSNIENNNKEMKKIMNELSNEIVNCDK